MSGEEQPPGGDAEERERRERLREERARERHAQEAEALEAAAHSVEGEALEAVELVIGEAEDTRLRRVTAIGIVVVSILAAIMVWRASVADEDAGRAEQSAQQNLIQRQQLVSSDESAVFHELRLFASYEQHSDLARELERDAARDPAAARGLLVQAQRERGLAREEVPLFEQVLPVTRPDGTVTYDAAYARSQQHLRDNEVLNLRSPEHLSAQAEATHRKGVRLTGLAALFVAALVMLTLAEINRREVARWFATAGAVVSVAAIVLFVLV